MPKVGEGVFASELVACIAEAHGPTIHELFTLPLRIPDRLMALRVAQAAL